MFVGSFSSDGSATDTASFAGQAESAVDIVRDVAVSATGQVAFTGYFNDAVVDIGADRVSNLGEDDAVIALFSSTDVD